MYTTTNYGFNIVEGTDMVNPLTQLNPNFTSLDTDLKAVSDATVDAATCIKTGTVHAVTRTNTDAKIFRFTATGNWNTGDTMTVDGTLVSVYLSDGSAPSNGCFVINTEVLAAIQGTRVTLYVNAGDASLIYFDDSNTSFTASNVQDAIEDVDTLAKGASDKIMSLAVVTVSQGSFTFDALSGTYRSNSPAATYTVRSILMVDVNLAGANNLIAHVNIDSTGYLVVTGVSPNGTKFNGTEQFTVKLLCINP